MTASVNNLGQPVLTGSVTYDVVKGKLPHHTVLGEKVTFAIEIASNQKIGEEDLNNSKIWEDLAKTVGGVVLGVASIALVAATIYEDFITVGFGISNDLASFALATAMMVTARKLMIHHGSKVARKALHWLVVAAMAAIVMPLQAAKATGLLDTKK
jgi:hypothetical protein